MIKVLENRIYHKIYEVTVNESELYDFERMQPNSRAEYFAMMIENILHTSREEGFILKTITPFEGSYIVVVAHK
jgi:hypothetical protein